MAFYGERDVSIDLKGRVSIPASFRDELRESYATETLVVTRNDSDTGLVAYPPSPWEEICSKVYALPAGPRREANLRTKIAPAESCSFNAQGRIQLPQSLRDRVGLEKDAVVVGMLDKIEIWSRKAHDAAIQDSVKLLAEDPQGQADLGF